MSDRSYIGSRAASVETFLSLQPVSKVILYVSDDVAFTAGEDGGRVLEATCIDGTQAMANDILRRAQAKPYTPITGTDALVDPATELGDGITLAGTFSVLGVVDWEANALGTADISAPGKREPESELGSYKGALEQRVTRSAAALRSSITKTAEEIRAEVANDIDGVRTTITQTADEIKGIVEDTRKGLQSSIDMTADKISWVVKSGTNESNFELTDRTAKLATENLTLTAKNNADNTQTTLSLSGNGMTVKSANINLSGLVTFTGLANGTTVINGGCIQTGQIDAEYLNLTGAISFGDLDRNTQGQINDANTNADYALEVANQAQNSADNANDVLSDWGYRGGSTYIDGAKIATGTVTAGTLQGGRIDMLLSDGSQAGRVTLTSASSGGYAVDLRSMAALRLGANAGYVFIESSYNASLQVGNGLVSLTPDAQVNGDLTVTGTIHGTVAAATESDETHKHSIEPLDDRYIAMLDMLEPKRYKFNDGTSDRYHIGFIAQDVQAAMESAGIDSTEFGGWIAAAGDDGALTYMLRYDEFIPLLWEKVRKLEAML